MKKKYALNFFKRGLLFSGFGPVIAGIIYLVLGISTESFTVSGTDVFTMIISTYLLAFIHAGASVFNQIEEWSVPKSLLFHFSALYISYSACYLINSWIPFNIVAFLIFTGAFVLMYFAIWITVYICITATSKRLNAAISK